MKKTLILFTVVAVITMTGCSSISFVNRDVVKDGDYILASDTQIITEVDLSKLNETEIKYAYEEIFARHGKIYSDDNLEKYFNSKEWYAPNPSFNEGDLSELEVENANYISNYIISNQAEDVFENTQNTNIVRYDENYYYQNYRGDNTYIIPDSSVRKLTVSELYGYSSNTLALIRNEIYARNGYVFTKQKYQDYFSSKQWYSPNPNFSESWLDSVEKYNIQLIKSME